MNMFLPSLKPLIAEFPRETAALEKLSELISNADNLPAYFPLKRIYDFAEFSSVFALNRVLERLEDEGVLKKIIRVVSEQGGGIGDFDSLIETPNEIDDFNLGKVVPVGQHNIQILYKLEQVR